VEDAYCDQWYCYHLHIMMLLIGLWDQYDQVPKTIFLKLTWKGWVGQRVENFQNLIYQKSQ
jgi:hypothetical protein